MFGSYTRTLNVVAGHARHLVAGSKNLTYVDPAEGLRLYYSYATVVAFESNRVLFVCQNIWSQTTACQLTRIERFARGRGISTDLGRLPYPAFVEVLADACKVHGVAAY